MHIAPPADLETEAYYHDMLDSGPGFDCIGLRFNLAASDSRSLQKETPASSDDLVYTAAWVLITHICTTRARRCRNKCKPLHPNASHSIL